MPAKSFNVPMEIEIRCTPIIMMLPAETVPAISLQTSEHHAEDSPLRPLPRWATSLIKNLTVTDLAERSRGISQRIVPALVFVVGERLTCQPQSGSRLLRCFHEGGSPRHAARLNRWPAPRLVSRRKTRHTRNPEFSFFKRDTIERSSILRALRRAMFARASATNAAAAPWRFTILNARFL